MNICTDHQQCQDQCQTCAGKETVFQPATIEGLFAECAEITRSKGFDVTQHATHIMLIATECAEALECVDGTCSSNSFRAELLEWARLLEHYRKITPYYTDASVVGGKMHLLEELADVQIRLASYVGGNGWTAEFLAALSAKVEKNRHRPHKHGKGF